MSTKNKYKNLIYMVDNPNKMNYTWCNNQGRRENRMAELEGRIKDVEEFAQILKSVKGTGREYKDFVAGAIAGVRMAWGMDKEKKAG